MKVESNWTVQILISTVSEAVFYTFFLIRRIGFSNSSIGWKRITRMFREIWSRFWHLIRPCCLDQFFILEKTENLKNHGKFLERLIHQGQKITCIIRLLLQKGSIKDWWCSSCFNLISYPFYIPSFISKKKITTNLKR